MKSLNLKLLLFSLVPFLIGVLILSAISFYKTDTLLVETEKKFADSIIKEKEALLRNQLIAVNSLVQSVLDKNKGIGKSKEEIIELLSNIRYLKNKSGYFFAYEKRDDGYYFGFHGTKPSLNGKKANIYKTDKKGYSFRQDLIKYATQEKYIRYFYERPKTKEIAQKMASSIYVPELKWTIVTGIYVDDIEKQMNEVISQINNKVNESLFVFFIAIVILIILTILIVTPIVKSVLISPITKFQNNLNNFFKYLNKEVSEVELEEIKSSDELGVMSKLLNDNVKQVQLKIDEDRKIIEDTIDVLDQFQKGDLSQRIKTNITDKSLLELKNVVNNMANNLESNINNVLKTLGEFCDHDYVNRINTQSLTNHLLSLGNGVNNLGEAITSMLIENKENGNNLIKSSKHLLSHVDNLNQSSSEAASNLEETATSLQQITSNIRNNTQNISKMSNLANDVTVAVKNGENLSSQTFASMDEINNQISSINEAITIIDQIAFQTNILSLNAAVEAATAGEAGKGFAVVAQEVRNLASRSAEAAKEIKELVENATNKADDGKHIANSMKEGYVNLNESILNTIELIKNIENSSQEQLHGIEQINSALSTLDRQTQNNAKIANESKEIAQSTNKIADEIIENVNSKNFNKL